MLIKPNCSNYQAKTTANQDSIGYHLNLMLVSGRLCLTKTGERFSGWIRIFDV